METLCVKVVDFEIVFLVWAELSKNSVKYDAPGWRKRKYILVGMGLLQFQNRNNMKKRKFYLSENFNHQTNTQPMLLQQLHKNQH